MLNFGASANHAKGIKFTDADYPEHGGMTAYTMLIGLRPTAAGWTTTRDIFSKLLGLNGWSLRTINSAGNNRIAMYHGDGAAVTAAATSTTNLVSGTTYIILIWWSGTTLRYYINGVSEGDVAFSTANAAAAAFTVIGNGNSTATGAQCALGPVILWVNYALTDAEIAQAVGGISVPASGYARLFHRGKNVPGVDEIKQIDGDEDGAVVLLTDDVADAFFMLQEVEDERLLATQLLLEANADEVAYSVKVPIHVAEGMELMDYFNVSHDALLRAETHLNAIGTPDNNQLFDKWRRGLYLLVGRSLDVMKGEVELTFVEQELAIATYLSSDVEPYGTSEGYPGVARMDIGGVLGELRNTTAWINQENDHIGDFQGGNFFAPVEPYISKINHQGLMSEEATTQSVVNPIFATQLTSWTSTTGGGGSTDAVENHRAFPDDDNTSVSIHAGQVIGAVGAENSIRQVVAVLMADGWRRFHMTRSDDQNVSADWKIQRSSDSRYWDNNAAAWVVGDTWNISDPPAWDTVNNQSIISMYWSKPIPVEANENWTVRFGKNNSATTHYFYVINLTIGRFRFLPLIEATTSVPDSHSTVVTVTESEIDNTNPINNGLVAAYLFDEGAGTTGATIRDVSGNGHHGTIVTSAGTPVCWATGFGIHDPAFILDKSPVEIGVQIPDHADFDFAGGFSIVLGYAARVAELAQFDTIVGKASTDAWNDGFTVATCQAGKMDFEFHGSIFAEGLQDEGTGETDYNDADYHLAVMTFDPAIHTEILYVDGTEREVKDNATSAHVPNASDLFLGRQPNATHRAFSGYLFFAYFYNRVLSPGEVTTLTEAPYDGFSFGDQRQILPTERFTVTLDMLAFQDSTDLVDNDQLLLWGAQIGEAGLDYYFLLYQKLAGQNVRFSFERWRDVAGVSTLDVRATKDVAIVKDQEYRITCRQIGLDGELGLPAKTMRINVDGVNGTDVVASELFSPFVGYSALWGTPPPGTGYKCSSNYLSYLRIQQRVITDEEWESA